MMFLGLEFEKLTYKVWRHTLSNDTKFVVRIDCYNKRFLFSIEGNLGIDIEILNVKIDTVVGNVEEIIEKNNIYQHLCNHELMLPFKILGNRTEKVKILL